jgi:uncharacterized protein YjbI with pentapeptide repeats
VILVLVVLVLWWFVRPTSVSQRKDFVQTVAQIVGGAALLSGLYFTWRGLQVNREGQITERFTRAIEQLGATDHNEKAKLEIRLGGIYALERIATDSPDRDYSTIMEVLTAYIRNNAPYSPNESPMPTAESPRADTQAILDVLTRLQDRVPQEYRVAPDLRETNLEGANLEGANLQEADLGSVNLQGALLRGANFHKASFFGMELNGAQFESANLSEARFGNCYLKEARFEKCNLQGACFGQNDLTSASFEKADLRGSSFIDLILEGSKFIGCNLEGAAFPMANLTGARFRQTEAPPRGAQLTRESLFGGVRSYEPEQGADLRKVNFRRAVLREADLKGANLQGANLQGANLQGVKHLTQEQLELALGDETTNLPQGLDRPKSWTRDDEKQTEGNDQA